MKYYNKPEKTVRDFFGEKGYTLDIEAFYRHPTTYKRRGVYSVDEVSPTIRGVNRPKPGTYSRHENDAVNAEYLPSIRSLTVRERAYIQTFPAEYIFDNQNISKGDLEQIVGNAVPIELAKLIAKSLMEYMEGVRLEKDSGFANWLRSDKKYGDRTIGDIFSRINRAKDILPEKPLNRYFITDLEETDGFSCLGTDVKSQIRSAIRLRIAYEALAERD
jgi:DNA (cytosine-5)-methyltransferase 1